MKATLCVEGHSPLLHADRLWRGAESQTHSQQPEAVVHEAVPLSRTFTASAAAGRPGSAVGGGGAGVGGEVGGGREGGGGDAVAEDGNHSVQCWLHSLADKPDS